MNRILNQLTLLLLVAAIGIIAPFFMEHWKIIVALVGLAFFVVVCAVFANSAPQQTGHSRWRSLGHKGPGSSTKIKSPMPDTPCMSLIARPRGKAAARPSGPDRSFVLQPKSVRRESGKANDPWYDGPATNIRAPTRAPISVSATAATNSWHSSMGAVYHNNTLCDAGRSIRSHLRHPGTGGRRLCSSCFRLNWRV